MMLDRSSHLTSAAVLSALALTGGMFQSGTGKRAFGQSCPAITAPDPLYTNAASDTGDDCCPQVATDGQGNWLAVWSSSYDRDGVIGNDFDILFSRSTDNGASWTTPAPLNTNADSDVGDDWVPKLATDHRGNWVALWVYFYVDVVAHEDMLVSPQHGQRSDVDPPGGATK